MLVEEGAFDVIDAEEATEIVQGVVVAELELRLSP